MALKTLCLLDFRHKKRRPRTSFFVEVVEPGGFEPPSASTPLSVPQRPEGQGALGELCKF